MFQLKNLFLGLFPTEFLQLLEPPETEIIKFYVAQNHLVKFCEPFEAFCRVIKSRGGSWADPSVSENGGWKKKNEKVLPPSLKTF